MSRTGARPGRSPEVALDRQEAERVVESARRILCP